MLRERKIHRMIQDMEHVLLESREGGTFTVKIDGIDVFAYKFVDRGHDCTLTLWPLLLLVHRDVANLVDSILFQKDQISLAADETVQWLLSWWLPLDSRQPRFEVRSTPSIESWDEIPSSSWEETPSSSPFPYQPPHVTRSAFPSTASGVQTGRSFSFTPSHFTGAGSNLRFKNGITYDELENTANSSRQKDPLVYAHTSVLGNAGGARINTGRDPTRTLAPWSSWKKVPGQLHPTLGDPQNPAVRFHVGRSDLRKIPRDQLHAALAGERKRQEEERARKESTRELGKRKRNQS